MSSAYVKIVPVEVPARAQLGLRRAPFLDVDLQSSKEALNPRVPLAADRDDVEQPPSGPNFSS